MRARAAAVIGLLGLGAAALAAGCEPAAEQAARSADASGPGGGNGAALASPASPAPPAPGIHREPGAADTTGAPELMAALGCGACHRGAPEPAEARRVAPSFGSGGPARAPDSLLAVLLAPSPRRTTASPARMPDFHLSRAEALALTLFLAKGLPGGGEEGDGRVEALREEHPAVDAELGRRLFLALGCAGCHEGTDVPAWKGAPDLASEGRRARRGWLTSWLARPTAVRPSGFYPGTGTRMPDFGLSSSELRTLVDHLASAEGGGDPARTDASGGRGPTGAAARPGPSGSAHPAPPATAPLSPFREAEAERLMARRSACLGCHALGDEGGRLAPDLAGVRLRRPDAYVWSMLTTPATTRPRTVMPRSPEGPGRDSLFFRLLTAADLPMPADSPRGNPDRAGYLDLVAHSPRAPDPWMLEGRPEPATAAARYRHLCAACHGVAGGGDGFNARHLDVPPAAHADPEAMAVRTDARLFNGVHGGGRVLGRSPHMPAFGASLSRDEVWGLVGRIRELCGCRGPDWYRDNEE